ncbi:MAG: class I SAM-dependent methyltransferase [Thermoanaerobaculia bacterium]
MAAHYDDLDRFYREIWGEHVHHGLWTTGDETPDQAVRELVRLVAAKTGIGAESRVCDVGCGYGATARQLAGDYSAQVVGLTISGVQHEVAAARLANVPGTRILHADWLNNEFEATSFSAVLSLECLAHVADKQRFFGEIFRVLEPGKRSAITAWMAAPRPRDWQIRLLLEPICREGRLAGIGTAAEYQELIEASGLELLEFQSLRPRVRKTWSICARRLLTGLMTVPAYRRFLIERPTANWVFLVALWRIILAYRVRALDYGLFVIRKP